MHFPDICEVSILSCPHVNVYLDCHAASYAEADINQLAGNKLILFGTGNWYGRGIRDFKISGGNRCHHYEAVSSWSF